VDEHDHTAAARVRREHRTEHGADAIRSVDDQRYGCPMLHARRV